MGQQHGGTDGKRSRRPGQWLGPEAQPLGSGALTPGDGQAWPSAPDGVAPAPCLRGFHFPALCSGTMWIRGSESPSPAGLATFW